MQGLEPDSELMQAITRMGHWIDPQRPRELTNKQKALIKNKPELIKTIKKQDQLVLELQS